MDESKLNPALSLKIMLRRSCLALEAYKKTVGKNIGSDKRHKEKQKLKYIGFSYEEINEMFHTELTKTNRY